MNLLQETLEKLAKHGKTTDDVYWVGSADGRYAISWMDFAENANFDYDESYGGAEIRPELVLVGEDWWLERAEYDGSEWWEFKQQPRKVQPVQSFKSMFDEWHVEEWQ